MRFGAVSYLNARPLVEGLAPLVLEPPARLVERHLAGDIDVALLPVAAAEAAGLRRVGTLGIASEGPVDSVLLFLRTTLDEVRTVRLDPDSRTSNVLAQVLLGVAQVVATNADTGADAEVVIGDRALQRAQGDEARVDLAALWTERTGLPFVFAAWYGDPAAEPALEAAYTRGREKLASYAAEAALGLEASALETYLRERIRFRLGSREEQGLTLFFENSRGLGLL